METYIQGLRQSVDIEKVERRSGELEGESEGGNDVRDRGVLRPPRQLSVMCEYPESPEARLVSGR